MSSVPAFKLVEAGFSQPQVEALAEFMQTEAARRSDLLEVEHRLEEKITAVRSEIVAAKIDTIKWMIGLTLAQVGLILTVIKLFNH